MGTGAERGARDFLAKLRTSALPHASCRGCRGRGGRGRGARGEGRRRRLRPASEACPGGPSHRTRPSGGEVRSEPRGGHGASTVGAKWASAAQNDLPGSPQDTSHGTRPPGASRRRWGGQGDRAGPPRAQAPSGSPGAGAAGGALPDRGLGTRAAAAGCRRKPPAAFRQFEEAQTGTQTGDFTRLTVGVYPATRTGNPGPRAGSEAGGRLPLCVQTQANAEVQHRRTVFRDSARQLTSQSNDCPWARVTRADRPGWPPRRTPR